MLRDVHNQHYKTAVTLVELMVGIGLLTLLFVTMQSFLTPGLKTTQVGNTTYSDLVTLTSFLEYLKKDIRICQKFAVATSPEEYQILVVTEKPLPGSLGPNLVEISYTQRVETNSKGEKVYIVSRSVKDKSAAVKKVTEFEFMNRFEFKLEKDPNTLNMIRITKLILEKQTMKKDVKNRMIGIDYAGAPAGTPQEVKMLETIGARSFYREIKDKFNPKP